MTSPRRRLPALVAGAALVLATILIAAPGTAASPSGLLRIKGPGFLYSGGGSSTCCNNGFVSEAISAGQTAQFELQVVNTGSALTQYNVKLDLHGLPASARLYTGSLLLTQVPVGPEGYFTAPIAPGKNQGLTLKVSIPAGSVQGSASVWITLSSTGGSYLSSGVAQAEVKAPTYGTTSTDVFAKQGVQPWVGGSVEGPGQAMTSPAVVPGGSAVFSVKLQNDGTEPAAIRVSAGPTNLCSVMSIKDPVMGNVTDSMMNGSYSTGTLAVHASRTLTITVKRTSTVNCPAYDSAPISASIGAWTNFHTVNLITPYPST